MSTLIGKPAGRLQPLLDRLRRGLADEERAGAELVAARCDVREMLLEARGVGMSYGQVAAALVPEVGERGEVRDQRASLDRDLRLRAFDTGCRASRSVHPGAGRRR